MFSSFIALLTVLSFCLHLLFAGNYGKSIIGKVGSECLLSDFRGFSPAYDSPQSSITDYYETFYRYMKSREKKNDILQGDSN